VYRHKREDRLEQITQSTPPLIDITPASRAGAELPQPTSAVAQAEQKAIDWYSRITGGISAVFLVAALVLWRLRPEHYRLTLGILIVAMLGAILHSYTFENADRA